MNPSTVVIVGDAGAQGIANTLRHPFGFGDVRCIPSPTDAIASAEPGSVLVAWRPVDARRVVEGAADRRCSVVVVCASDEEAESVFSLDEFTSEASLDVVVAGGFAPGLIDVLASHAAALFDAVDDVRIARVGSADDESARALRRALRRAAAEWRDGALRPVRRTGPERVWFPDPIGPRDCEAVDLGLATLRRAFADASVVSRAAVADDRWARRHRPGGIAAVRVEVSGFSAGRRDSVVYGAVGPAASFEPCVVAATVAALADPTIRPRPSVHGVGEAVPSVRVLDALASGGISVYAYEGVVE